MFAIFKRKYKKALTLMEVVIVIVMISAGILTLYYTISKGLDFVNFTREKLIAIEIAKEGMEAVYNIRDTNWTRWSGKKDKCWLKVNPLINENSEGCENDTWIQSGNYIIKLASKGDQKYRVLSGVDANLNIFDGIDADDEIFQVCLSGGYWNSCSEGGISHEGKFFREIHVLGLVDKFNNDNNTYLTCGNGTDSDCGNSSSKELRFCSIVQFFAGVKGNVKMCGVLTNFLE